MNERELDLTEAQIAVKSKYPPINRKYECKSDSWSRATCVVFVFSFVNRLTNVKNSPDVSTLVHSVGIFYLLPIALS